MGRRSWTGLVVVAGVGLVLGQAMLAVAAGPPLRRDLSAFLVFALKNADLKNFSVDGACNVGVNCDQPSTNSDCGVLTQENPLYADGSQIAGDVTKFTKPGGDVDQVFTNQLVSPQNVNIRTGVMPLTPLPILDDEDNDGTPSCRTVGGQCVTDAGDLYAACGFPVQFPTCDFTKPVLVLANGDCSPPTPDAAPGNGRCDLAAGTYGTLTVQNAGKLTFTGGTYTFCSMNLGKSTNTIASAPADLFVVGDIGINNDATFGQDCDDIHVFAKGPGGHSFGRNSFIAGRFCAPERTMFLGHNNDLTGQFIGDTVNADSNDRGHCCGGVAGTCTTNPPPIGTRPLDRDLNRYVIVAQKHASLKNIAVDAPCDVGVNCAPTSGSGACGVMSLADVTFVDGSQTVAHEVFFRKPGAVIDQLFRNGGGPLNNVTFEQPVQPFNPTPIFPGTCGPGCAMNQSTMAAMEALCGFPQVFPACDPSKSVKAVPGGDCSAFDSNPGNGACDLPPGVYGAIYVQNGAILNLQAGTYVACSFRGGRNVDINAVGTTVLIPANGSFKVNNGSTVAETCGDLTVLVKGVGQVSFGRNLTVAAKVCAPTSTVKLGHNNRLIGQFIGQVVNADLNNHAECCVPRCVCSNPFTPTTATVGQTITIDADADCDLSQITAVTVCGVNATITVSTPTELKFTVPAGVSGACKVGVGSFDLSQLLTVN